MPTLVIMPFIALLIRSLFKLALGVGAVVLVLSLLVAGLVGVLAVGVWSLVTGRKPAPVVVFQHLRRSSQRFTRGVWPAHRAPGTSPRAGADIVDVQARDITESRPDGGNNNSTAAQPRLP
ncbi:MAG: hypothetical protein RI920_2419 [Pseudomonadota bacterium]